MRLQKMAHAGPSLVLRSLCALHELRKEKSAIDLMTAHINFGRNIADAQRWKSICIGGDSTLYP